MENLYRECERYPNNPALPCGECSACLFNQGLSAAYEMLEALNHMSQLDDPDGVVRVIRAAMEIP